MKSKLLQVLIISSIIFITYRTYTIFSKAPSLIREFNVSDPNIKYIIYSPEDNIYTVHSDKSFKNKYLIAYFTSNGKIIQSVAFSLKDNGTSNGDPKFYLNNDIYYWTLGEKIKDNEFKTYVGTIVADVLK